MDGSLILDGNNPNKIADFRIQELRVSHSSRSIGCDRKFEFRKLYPRGKSKNSLAGDVGHTLHEAYQTYLATGNLDQALMALMLRYPIELCDDPLDFRSLEATYATFMAMINSVKMAEYQIATIKCLDGKERPAIEVPFRINLKNIFIDEEKTIPIFYVGYIDLILFHILTNEYTTLDVKTHRDNLKDLTPKYAFDEQCLPYGLVLEHMLGHIITGFDIHYLSCFVDIREPKIMLYTFEKSRQEIQDWMIGLAQDIKKWQANYKMNWWRRNSNSCIQFHKYICDYFQYCQMRDKQTLLNMLWTPDTIQEDDKFVPWIEFELDLQELA